MNSKNKIIFDECFGEVTEERIKLLNQTIGVSLPRSFIDLVKVCDGGIPKACDFDYFNIAFQEKWGSGIGSFLALNPSEYSDLLSEYNNPPEFFPKDIIAFADTGGGDYICFDYRKDKNSIDPPIVIWNHEANEGKDVSFVANNFEEFLSILKEPEDIEE